MARVSNKLYDHVDLTRQVGGALAFSTTLNQLRANLLAVVAKTMDKATPEDLAEIQETVEYWGQENSSEV